MINRETICCDCKRVYTYARGLGHTTVRCNSCMALKRKKQMKKLLVELLGGQCSVCGYNKCIEALEFHHLDPSIKGFTISKYYNRKTETLIEEASKCVLLCANCHAEEHARQNMRD